MRIDHLVVRTPHRDAVVSALVDRTGRSAMAGYSERQSVVSRGVRFANGPFFDIFSWPPDMPRREPLVALEGEIDRAQELAARQGWAAVAHRPGDGGAAPAPPWSTLSFRRGQGLISSIFVIEYDDASPAWRNPDFAGALYARRRRHDDGAQLSRIVIGSADLDRDRAQLGALQISVPPVLAPAEADGAGFAWAEITVAAESDALLIWRHER
jgi:hypothetical protein